VEHPFKGSNAIPATLRPLQQKSIINQTTGNKLEVHRLSADNRYQPIIGQFADNRYRPFDNRHQPMPIIGRLFVLESRTTKMLLTAVHIDDNEITNDSVISQVSSLTFI